MSNAEVKLIDRIIIILERILCKLISATLAISRKN